MGLVAGVAVVYGTQDDKGESHMLDGGFVVFLLGQKKPSRTKSRMEMELDELQGRDVHVTTTSRAISSFMDGDRSGQICFRCGELGHMRYQCLTYRVRVCWHHQNGECTDPYCAFAHGPEQLRTPWKARCVRVVKQSGRLVCIGCNSTANTFRRCLYHTDLLFL